MAPNILSEHKWLHRFVGKWRTCNDPEAPAEQDFEGAEVYKAIGENWIQGESIVKGKKGEPDQISLTTIGFDPEKGKFVGSWVGTMMNMQWIYEGDKVGENRLVLDSVGPSFDGTPGEQVYRDIYEFTDDNHRIMKSYVQKSDMKWELFMTIHADRVSD